MVVGHPVRVWAVVAVSSDVARGCEEGEWARSGVLQGGGRIQA